MHSARLIDLASTPVANGVASRPFERFTRRALFACAASCVFVRSGDTRAAKDSAPPTFAELRKQIRTAAEPIALTGLPSIAGRRRGLLTYRLRDLVLKALVTWPSSASGNGPWAVVLALHGYHPDPRRYGVLADGTNQRPGAYYASIPEAFSAGGFITVMPDYRGHNDSDGQAAQGMALSNAYYAEDAAALVPVIPSIFQAKPDSLHLWGHSMGADIGLRLAVALGTQTGSVRSASFWSTAGGRLEQQIQFYARVSIEQSRTRLNQDLASVSASNRASDYEALDHIEEVSIPLLMQHAVGDEQAPVQWSRQLSDLCHQRSRQCQLRLVTGADHFFSGAQFDEAIGHDMAWFRAHG